MNLAQSHLETNACWPMFHGISLLSINVRHWF